VAACQRIRAVTNSRAGTDTMEGILTRFVSDLIGRLTGPRLFLQPAVAGFFALRDGLKDAREGRPPHFW
jgi:hypothetical protein